MEQVLQQILTKLNEIDAVMVTKDELNEIKQTMATKDELNEIKQTMATKDELNEIRQTMSNGFEGVNKKLNAISAQVAYNAEQNFKISQLEMEVRVIKKAIANL